MRPAATDLCGRGIQTNDLAPHEQESDADATLDLGLERLRRVVAST
jgi:hypothetical protein